MSGKHKRRARRLQLYRSSLAHRIRVFSGRRDGGCERADGENGFTRPIKLTARTKSVSMRIHIKPDEFSRLLWGAQSWRRPH